MKTMETQIVYCISCREKKEFTVKSRNDTITIRNITFTYTEQFACCKDCGDEVYVPEINDLNVQAREDAFREAAHLITVEQVKKILAKYNIGAAPLALLMGFGEVTITRYVNGQLPAAEHSRKLLEVLNSYKVMESYLEAGKDRITDVAYSKCRRCLDEIKKNHTGEKIDIVAKYILYRLEDITHLALQKLLYFSQAFYAVLFHESLFPDQCQAWVHGPVYPSIYHLYKNYSYESIDCSTDEFRDDISMLTPKEATLIDAILASFGQYSGSVLREISHNELPWIEARGTLRPTELCATVIDPQTIEAYFSSVVRDYQISKPDDISRYCAAMVQIIQSNRRSIQ